MEGGMAIEMKGADFKLATPKVRIAPSVLAADFAKLGDEVRQVEQAGAPMLHVDVMDGNFVPNISLGPPVIASLRKCTKLFLDVHLMIAEPAKYAEAFVKAGSDHLTFHIEAVDDPEPVIKHIRTLGVSVGVALNPTTPVSAIESILDQVDMVVVMSVWPGFGGQKFIHDVLEKVAELSRRLAPHQRLQIDGGVDTATIGAAAAAGADTFVAGTAVFRQPQPAAAMAELERLAGDVKAGQSDVA